MSGPSVTAVGSVGPCTLFGRMAGSALLFFGSRPCTLHSKHLTLALNTLHPTPLNPEPSCPFVGQHCFWWRAKTGKPAPLPNCTQWSCDVVPPAPSPSVAPAIVPAPPVCVCENLCMDMGMRTDMQWGMCRCGGTPLEGSSAETVLGHRHVSVTMFATLAADDAPFNARL